MSLKLIFVFIAITINFKTLSQDCSACQKELLSNTKKLTNYAKKLDQYLVKEKALEFKIENLKKQVSLLGPENEKVIDELKADLEKNKIIFEKKNREIKNFKKELIASNNDRTQLNKNLLKLESKLKSIEYDLEMITLKSKRSDEILKCIKDFESTINKPEPEIVANLSRVRDDFIEYNRLKRAKSNDDETMEDIINRVIQSYEKYKGSEVEMNCGGIRLSVFQDYLTVEDYMNIAEIYGKNLEGAVYSLEGENKINGANRIILEAAGKIMENGNYDQRTYISTNLSRFVTEERKSGSDFTEVRSNVDRVYSLYMEGKYLEALLLFDKYEKFLSDPDLNAGTKTRAMLGVGIILFWDLAGIQGNIYSFNFGEWLSKGNNINSIGKDLLTKVIDDKMAAIEIRKNASIALSKYYHE